LDYDRGPPGAGVAAVHEFTAAPARHEEVTTAAGAGGPGSSRPILRFLVSAASGTYTAVANCPTGKVALGGGGSLWTSPIRRCTRSWTSECKERG
jgi:hypothetical protein